MNERSPRRRVEDLSLVGGHPALDFANTVSSRQARTWDDRIGDVEDLRAWGVHAGLLDPGATPGSDGGEGAHGDGPALFERAIALREAIHGVFAALADGEAPPEASVKTLSAAWSDARGHERLRVTSDGEVGVRMEATSALDRLLRTLAVSAGDLLLEAIPARLKVCAADDCGYLYLDASRNRSRRWCDMAECGNRDKVRRFRARHDDSG